MLNFIFICYIEIKLKINKQKKKWEREKFTQIDIDGTRVAYVDYTLGM